MLSYAEEETDVQGSVNGVNPSAGQKPDLLSSNDLIPLAKKNVR